MSEEAVRSKAWLAGHRDGKIAIERRGGGAQPYPSRNARFTWIGENWADYIAGWGTAMREKRERDQKWAI